jgi:predicted anti-sigma-YlaC factor YlaD
MNKKPKCSDVFKHICDKLDKDLNSTECRAIKKHLDDCPDCTVYMNSLKKTIELYRAYPEPRLTKSRRNRLLSVIHQ